MKSHYKNAEKNNIPYTCFTEDSEMQLYPESHIMQDHLQI